MSSITSNCQANGSVLDNQFVARSLVYRVREGVIDFFCFATSAFTFRSVQADLSARQNQEKQCMDHSIELCWPLLKPKEPFWTHFYPEEPDEDEKRGGVKEERSTEEMSFQRPMFYYDPITQKESPSFNPIFSTPLPLLQRHKALMVLSRQTPSFSPVFSAPLPIPQRDKALLVLNKQKEVLTATFLETPPLPQRCKALVTTSNRTITPPFSPLLKEGVIPSIQGGRLFPRALVGGAAFALTLYWMRPKKEREKEKGGDLFPQMKPTPEKKKGKAIPFSSTLQPPFFTPLWQDLDRFSKLDVARKASLPISFQLVGQVSTRRPSHAVSPEWQKSLTPSTREQKQGNPILRQLIIELDFDLEESAVRQELKDPSTPSQGQGVGNGVALMTREASHAASREGEVLAISAQDEGVGNGVALMTREASDNLAERSHRLGRHPDPARPLELRPAMRALRRNGTLEELIKRSIMQMEQNIFPRYLDTNMQHLSEDLPRMKEWAVNDRGRQDLALKWERLAKEYFRKRGWTWNHPPLSFKN